MTNALTTLEHDTENILGEIKVAITGEAGGVKPGIQTTEFWATLLTHAAWILSLIFHKDLSPYVPAAAIGAAAISTSVYGISRAITKRPTSIAAAVTDAKALEPVLADTIDAGKQIITDINTAKATTKAPAKS